MGFRKHVSFFGKKRGWPSNFWLVKKRKPPKRETTVQVASGELHRALAENLSVNSSGAKSLENMYLNCNSILFTFSWFYCEMDLLGIATENLTKILVVNF